jgi:Tfp pilus assembly protein PilF
MRGLFYLRGHMKINLQEQIDKGLAILQDEKADQAKLNHAEDIFNAILNLDSKSETMLFYIASVFMKKKYIALAIYLYEIAIKINPNLSCVWNNLGFAHREERRINEARICFENAVKINPDDADLWMNLGGTYNAIGEPDKAIYYTDKALAINPEHPNALWNKSLAYLEKGDYEAGWKLYDAGVRTTDRQERQYHNGGTPKWNGEKGKNIVIYGEQGIGDEIMFASIIPDVAKDCNIIFDAHPRLYEIFRHSFPGIPIFGTRKDAHVAWPQFFNIDARIAIGSLCKFYRNKLEDFPRVPYLKADPKLIEKYKELLPQDKMNIGISWRGGVKQTNAKERYIKLDLWKPIFESFKDKANFYSLQYGDKAEDDIEKFEKENPDLKILHYPETIDDYDETAGFVTCLDFIVSVPQSVVHLAGALGTPTLQLTPKHAMWQMGVYGEDLPWYGCVKSIWQEKAGDWESVINEARNQLCNLYQMSIQN